MYNVLKNCILFFFVPSGDKNKTPPKNSPFFAPKPHIVRWVFLRN